MKKHKDVEFQISETGRHDLTQLTVDRFDEAVARATIMSMTTGSRMYIDVLVYSEAGARALEGDEGVEQYREDPEASVFKRITIKAEDHGRVA